VETPLRHAAQPEPEAARARKKGGGRAEALPSGPGAQAAQGIPRRLATFCGYSSPNEKSSRCARFLRRSDPPCRLARGINAGPPPAERSSSREGAASLAPRAAAVASQLDCGVRKVEAGRPVKDVTVACGAGSRPWRRRRQHAIAGRVACDRRAALSLRVPVPRGAHLGRSLHEFAANPHRRPSRRWDGHAPLSPS
jgi:hypothetical protein